jgi:hypothetical protein
MCEQAREDLSALRAGKITADQFETSIRALGPIAELVEDGRTLLHDAAAALSVEGVETLLRLGADPNAVDKNGKTPFWYISVGHCDNLDSMTQIAHILHSHGAVRKDHVMSAFRVCITNFRPQSVEFSEWLLDTFPDMFEGEYQKLLFFLIVYVCNGYKSFGREDFEQHPDTVFSIVEKVVKRVGSPAFLNQVKDVDGHSVAEMLEKTEPSSLVNRLRSVLANV